MIYSQTCITKPANSGFLSTKATLNLSCENQIVSDAPNKGHLSTKGHFCYSPWLTLRTQATFVIPPWLTL